MILYEEMIDDLNFNYELDSMNALFESYLLEFSAKETLNKIWESIKKFFKETLPKILKNLSFKIGDLKAKIKKEDIQKKTNRILNNIKKGRKFTMQIPQLDIDNDGIYNLENAISDSVSKIDINSMSVSAATSNGTFTIIKVAKIDPPEVSDKKIGDYIKIKKSDPVDINTKIIQETKDSIFKIQYNIDHVISNYINGLNKNKATIEKGIDFVSSKMGKNIKSSVLGFEFNIGDDVINKYINTSRELINDIVKTLQAVNFQLSIYNSMLNGYVSIINTINKEIGIDIKYD